MNAEIIITQELAATMEMIELTWIPSAIQMQNGMMNMQVSCSNVIAIEADNTSFCFISCRKPSWKASMLATAFWVIASLFLMICIFANSEISAVQSFVVNKGRKPIRKSPMTTNKFTVNPRPTKYPRRFTCFEKKLYRTKSRMLE